MSGHEPRQGSDLRCRSALAISQSHAAFFSRNRVDVWRLARVALVAVEEEPIPISTENGRHIM